MTSKTSDQRQLIIAIIAESGAGKTTLAEHLKFFFGINLIESYTDRPRRTPDEIGHTFMDKNEFDQLDANNYLAYTIFGDYRYCCLYSDLAKLNSYVIDENGYSMLKRLDQSKYLVKSIRIVCSEAERLKRAGLERVNRDNGRFTIPYSEFDIIYNSEKFASIVDDEISLEKIKGWIKEVKQ